MECGLKGVPLSGLIICDMKMGIDQLKTIVGFFLPKGILDHFDVVDVKLSENKGEERDLFPNILNMYLDEKDTLPAENKGTLKPDGFTEETLINDMPVRDNKLCLHIRRRKWLSEDGTPVVLDTMPLVAEGTDMSPDLMDFLRNRDGQYSTYGDAVRDIVMKKFPDGKLK